MKLHSTRDYPCHDVTRHIHKSDIALITETVNHPPKTPLISSSRRPISQSRSSNFLVRNTLHPSRNTKVTRNYAYNRDHDADKESEKPKTPKFRKESRCIKTTWHFQRLV